MFTKGRGLALSVMLCGTGLWIANNLIVGSIGGTALEIVIAAINLTTIARLVREYRKILSIAIAQTQTEQANSPSMTAFTTQWACRNRAISDTSAETNGDRKSVV